jgi:hypothetical protein
MGAAKTTEPIAKKKPSKSSVRVKSNIEAERECELWLSEQMSKSPNLKPKPKRDWRKEVRRRWPGKISEMRFKVIWSNCIRMTGAHVWAQSGAPTRPRSSKSVT